MEHHQKTFELIRAMVSNLPTMKALKLGKPLCIPSTTTKCTIGALLAREGSEKKEHPIYYVRRHLNGSELQYPYVEKKCIALIYASAAVSLLPSL